MPFYPPRKPVQTPGAHGATHWHRTKTGTVHYDNDQPAAPNPTAPANPPARFHNADAVATQFASQRLSSLSPRQADWLMREAVKHGNSNGQAGARGNVVGSDGKTTATWEMTLNPGGGASFRVVPLPSQAAAAKMQPKPQPAPAPQPAAQPAPQPAPVAAPAPPAPQGGLPGVPAPQAPQQQAMLPGLDAPVAGKKKVAKPKPGQLAMDFDAPKPEPEPEKAPEPTPTPEPQKPLEPQPKAKKLAPAPAPAPVVPPSVPEKKVEEQAPAPPGDQNGDTPDHYMIPEHRLGPLQDKFAKLQKKAAKLGLTKPELHILGKENHEVKKGGGQVEVHTRYKVKVSGGEPILNGWKFIGTAEHAGEAGNVLNSVPNEKIPLKYRTANATTCEHCNQNRKRTKTFILEKEGEHKQVGSNCIKDFLGGHGDPNALAKYAEEMIDAEQGLSEGDEEGREWGSGTKRKSTFLTEHYLAHVAENIAQNGWISKAAGREGKGRPTADAAWENMVAASKGERTVNRGNNVVYTPSAESEEIAKKALAHVRGLYGDYEGDDDFKWNLRLLTQHGSVDEKKTGLVGYVVQHYLRDMEKQKEQKQNKEAEEVKRQAAPADLPEHMGQAGDKIKYAQLKVVNTKDIAGDYGTTTLYTFQDQYGRKAKWFSSGNAPFEEGKVYQVKATVKGTGAYNGVPETTLTRVAPIPTEAEKNRSAQQQLDLVNYSAEEEVADKEHSQNEQALREELKQHAYSAQYTPGSEHYDHPLAAKTRESANKRATAGQKRSEAYYSNLNITEAGELPDGFSDPEPEKETAPKKAGRPKKEAATDDSTPAPKAVKDPAIKETKQKVADTKAHIDEITQKISKAEADAKGDQDAAHQAYHHFLMSKDEDRKKRGMGAYQSSTAIHYSPDFEPYADYQKKTEKAGAHRDIIDPLYTLKNHLEYKLKQHQIETKPEGPQRNADLAHHQAKHYHWLSNLRPEEQEALTGRRYSYEDTTEANRRSSNAQMALNAYKAKKQLGQV